VNSKVAPKLFLQFASLCIAKHTCLRRCKRSLLCRKGVLGNICWDFHLRLVLHRRIQLLWSMLRHSLLVLPIVLLSLQLCLQVLCPGLLSSYKHTAHMASPSVRCWWDSPDLDTVEPQTAATQSRALQRVLIQSPQRHHQHPANLSTDSLGSLCCHLPSHPMFTVRSGLCPVTTSIQYT
jgi:hypothetical protein